MYREDVFSETVSNMFSAFRSQAELFTMKILNMILLSAVIGAVCLLFFVWKRKEWVTTGLNFVFLILSWSMYAAGDAMLTYVFSLTALAVSGIRLLFLKDLRSAVTGILLSAGLLSALMVLPSKSYGSRLIVPLYLFLCLVLILCTSEYPAVSYGLQIGLFAFSSILLFLTCPHYLYNYRIEMKNEAYLKEMKTTHELWYDVDYDKGKLNHETLDNIVGIKLTEAVSISRGI